MNINSMKYYYELKESLEHELVNFASQVQFWKEAGVLHDATFEKCKSCAADIQSDINRMESDRTLFMNCINNLSDYKYQQVIMERHVFDKIWSDIADKLNISSQYIQKRIYPAALQEFNALLAGCSGD